MNQWLTSHFLQHTYILSSTLKPLLALSCPLEKQLICVGFLICSATKDGFSSYQCDFWEHEGSIPPECLPPSPTLSLKAVIKPSYIPQNSDQLSRLPSLFQNKKARMQIHCMQCKCLSNQVQVILIYLNTKYWNSEHCYLWVYKSTWYKNILMTHTAQEKKPNHQQNGFWLEQEAWGSFSPRFAA